MKRENVAGMNIFCKIVRLGGLEVIFKLQNFTEQNNCVKLKADDDKTFHELIFSLHRSGRRQHR